MTSTKKIPQNSEISSDTSKPGDNYSFGIDIGGTGIKGAIVNLEDGTLVSERFRIPTPQPATPSAVAQVVLDIVDQAKWTGSVGLTMPSVIKNQKVKTATNIDDSWINIDTHKLFRAYLGHRDVTIINDADAAGLAENLFGEGSQSGLELLITVGTGIGSALTYNGTLIPNLELGTFPYKKHTAEHYASARARERKDLSWKKWGARLTEVLKVYENLFSPELIILGGGISKKSDKWFKYLDIDTPFVATKLKNNAGIVGAAVALARNITP